MKITKTTVLCIFFLAGILANGCNNQNTAQGRPASTDKPMARVVTDMRGVQVPLPQEIKRVAIFDKGFLVQTMTALGVSDTIVASGGLIQTATQKTERDSLYLYPALLELPELGYPTGAVDFETLAKVNPDLVILRNSEYIKDSEITAEMIKKIEEDLKMRLVVVNGPGCYDEVRIETQYEGISLMGEVFDKEGRAGEIISLMRDSITMITEKTKDVPADAMPAVMYIGGLTGKDLSGTVWGANYGDAKFSEEAAHIKNVYPEHNTIRKVSAEQIITFNPEVIVLCTVSPSPEVFLNDPLYAPLRNVRAVQNKRIASVGLLTWWGDFRLEVPTILLIAAKNVYPGYFKDINVGQWLNAYHRSLYRLSEEQAQELKQVQQLDWMDSMNF